MRPTCWTWILAGSECAERPADKKGNAIPRKTLPCFLTLTLDITYYERPLHRPVKHLFAAAYFYMKPRQKTLTVSLLKCSFFHVAAAGAYFVIFAARQPSNCTLKTPKPCVGLFFFSHFRWKSDTWTDLRGAARGSRSKSSLASCAEVRRDAGVTDGVKGKQKYTWWLFSAAPGWLLWHLDSVLGICCFFKFWNSPHFLFCIRSLSLASKRRCIRVQHFPRYIRGSYPLTSQSRFRFQPESSCSFWAFSVFPQ